MTNEQKVLLSLLTASVNGRNAEPCDCAVDWQTVFAEAEYQAVLLMAVDAALALKQNIQSDVYERWTDRAVSCLVKNAEVETSQIQLKKLLGDRYSYAILKGESAASYYPEPTLRMLGDVDFLINPDQNDEISALLSANGFESSYEEHECHTVFKKGGAHLEMHREIAGIPCGEVGEKIREISNTVIENASAKDGFSRPCDFHHGLIILLHMQHHMVAEGIGLRHLCDWALFVNKTATEPFWETEFLPLLEQIGLLTYAATMTKTASIALGTKCPEWAEAADKQLCEKVIEDIFSGGNFGSKDRAYSRAGFLISEHGKDGFEENKYKRAISTIKASIERQHPVVEKYRILYPVFFVQKLLRYLVLWITGKRPSIKKLSRFADTRKELYQQLKIFEVTKCSKTTEN